MTTLTEQKRSEYETVLRDLIYAARMDGIVLSIDTVRPPGFALAMGNYVLVGEARLAKELYRGNP